MSGGERWQRVQHVFEEALAQPAGSRGAYLESACGSDIGLRDEVTSLLAAHEQSGEVGELPSLWLRLLAGEEAPRFAVGEQVGGRYLVRGLLGRGGMGEVYEAWDEELSIPVALKTLHLPAGSEEEAFQRLKREGLLARSVLHPNVCRAYDLGRHGEGEGRVWFLTMEVLRGETLADRLRAQRKLPSEKAMPLAEQMAAGLGAAHQAGVVHRDFKPSNVMLVREGADEQAVVTDFGIARAAGAAERETQIAGTPAYMAPEQVRGEEVGPAADIYALGIVLYEMVTGTLPFTGGTGIEVARRRLVEKAPPPRSVVPELDERLEAVILRCLAREPRRRFGRAEEVVEALAGRARVAEVGALEMVPRARHTLPAERDMFVGREAELAEIERKLAGGGRLVTLVGAGGMGKTRLAVRYGWRSLGEWPGGVWFCDLTEARSIEGIASAVAGSLGVALGRGDPIEQLGHAIAGRGRCLVILDNFEQVVEHAGMTVSRWMKRAGEARFVVTSRERLSLGDAEQVQTVEPLSPDSGVELFTARARWLRPGLEFAGTEADSAREVVRLVEGMPLAIELAAARMRVMSAAQIVAQMRKRFHLLTGGPSARHETLKAAIDGSWELLRPWEKAAWAQCAVFEGGFTLEAAEAVVDLTGWPEAPWVVDVLQSLVDMSLLRTWVPGVRRSGDMSEVRFGMYVSLQEYARMKLREEGAIAGGGSGVEAERAAEERHGKWYARYGRDEALEVLYRHGHVERWWRLQRELENLVLACRRAVARGEGAIATAAYRAAAEVLNMRGPFGVEVDLGREVSEGPLCREDRVRALTTLGQAELHAGKMDEARAHFEAALAIQRDVGDRRLEGVLLGRIGILHNQRGRLDHARANLEAALAIHREVGNRRFEGIVLGNLGTLHLEQGRMEEARAHYEAALAIHREVGDPRGEGDFLGNLGIVHYEQGRVEEARTHHEAALAIHREVGDRRLEGVALGRLGIVNHEQGRMEEARVHYEAALAIHREIGNRRFEGVTLGYLGSLHYEQGQKDEARAYHEAALAIHRELGDRRFEGVALGNLGDLDMDQGRMEEARAHHEAALAIHRELGHRRFEGVALGNLGNLHLHQGRMEEAREAFARGEALLREVGDRVELGKLLCVRVELERRIGDLAASQATLGEAEALAVQVGAGPDSELGRQLARLRQVLVKGHSVPC